jgi:hypothetical protein
MSIAPVSQQARIDQPLPVQPDQPNQPAATSPTGSGPAVPSTPGQTLLAQPTLLSQAVDTPSPLQQALARPSGLDRQLGQPGTEQRLTSTPTGLGDLYAANPPGGPQNMGLSNIPAATSQINLNRPVGVPGRPDLGEVFLRQRVGPQDQRVAPQGGQFLAQTRDGLHPLRASNYGDALTESRNRLRSGGFSQPFERTMNPGDLAVLQRDPKVRQALEQNTRFGSQLSPNGSPPRALAPRLFSDHIRRDGFYDGALIGRNGTAYPAGTPLSQIPPLTANSALPAGTRTPSNSGRDVLFVPGITRPRNDALRLMQTVANDQRVNVIGVHNATTAFLPTDWDRGASGAPGDVLGQSREDYNEMLAHRSNLNGAGLLNNQNATTASLADAIHQRLMSGARVNIMAESQGALITSNAISRVEDRLLRQYGYDPTALPWDAAGQRRNEEAQRLTQTMLGRINVSTFNGASSYYPSGPNYTHVRNTQDGLVANPLGMGQAGADGGRGSREITINRDHLDPIEEHAFQFLWRDMTPAQREASIP